MKATDLKTIDITTLVWFDKTHGNSYFAQEITLNYGLESAEVHKNPFQYGYDSYQYEALDFLGKNVFPEFKDSKAYYMFKFCDENKIIIRSNTYRGCKKRELINI